MVPKPGILRAVGSFDAAVLTGRIEAGYPIETALAEITPFAALEPSWIDQPAFVEAPSLLGSPLFALAFSGRTATSRPTSLGLQLDRAAVLDDGWTLAPYLRAAWVHNPDDARALTANLPAAPGAGFTVAGTPAMRDAARLTGSLKLAQGTTVPLYANVEADLSAHGQAVAANLGFKLSW